MATWAHCRTFSRSQPEWRFIGAPENGLAAAFARAKVAGRACPFPMFHRTRINRLYIQEFRAWQTPKPLTLLAATL